MNVPNNYPELTHKTANFAIGDWENEGGAPGQQLPGSSIWPPRRGGSLLDRLPCLQGFPARIRRSDTMTGLSQELRPTACCRSIAATQRAVEIGAAR